LWLDVYVGVVSDPRPDRAGVLVAALQEEFDYYLAHQDELVGRYDGKFLVIRDKQVRGAYDSELEAYRAASSDYEPGSFLIQRCAPGDEAYSQTFFSRVGVC
jgi:hypothetical protein